MNVRLVAVSQRVIRLLLCTGVVAVPAVLHAQKNEFDLIIDGKKMGKDVYTLKPDKAGFVLNSRFSIKVPASDTAPMSMMEMTDEFKLSPDYNYLEGSVTDHTDYAHHVTYTKSKTGDELTVANYSGNHPVTDIVAVKPAFLMFTPMDAGTAQTLLLGFVGHSGTNDMYNVFLADPLSRGGGGGGGGRRGGGGGGAAADSGGSDALNGMFEFKLFKGKDSGGTLDGKPVLLHTYMLAAGKMRYIFYADEANNLMRVDAPALKATYMRVKFQPNAPKPAGAPDAAAPAKP